MKKVLACLARVHKSYQHFFQRYAKDPEFAVKAFTSLVLTCLIGFLSVLVDVVMGGGNQYVLPQWAYYVIFFGSAIAQFRIPQPEPRKNDIIALLSIAVVVAWITHVVWVGPLRELVAG